MLDDLRPAGAGRAGRAREFADAVTQQGRVTARRELRRPVVVDKFRVANFLATAGEKNGVVHECISMCRPTAWVSAANRCSPLAQEPSCHYCADLSVRVQPIHPAPHRSREPQAPWSLCCVPNDRGTGPRAAGRLTSVGECLRKVHCAHSTGLLVASAGGSMPRGREKGKRCQPSNLGDLHSVIVQIWWLAPFRLPASFKDGVFGDV